ncbi:MAG: hypothetical protein AB9846_05540 [Tenuifilaceae bacterium]
MKKILFIILYTISINSIGQNDIKVYTDKSSLDIKEQIPLRNQFLDTMFYQGRVYFKNGGTSGALMNYNLLNNGILFVDKEKKVLILDGLENISMITYSKRVFLPYEGSVLEQIHLYKNDIALLLKRKTYVDKHTTGPYGIKMDPSETERVAALDGFVLHSKYYQELKSEVNITVTMELQYFLKINDKIKPVSKIKDLKKLFPNKKDSLLDYIHEKNLNMGNVNDLNQLIKFCINEETI